MAQVDGGDPLKSCRNVCFTLWSEGEEGSPDFFFPLLFPKFWPDCTYCVYSLERGEACGRLHYQGYAEFVGQKRFKWIHANCDGMERAALFVRKGTQEEAIRYCEKSETHVEGPWVFGCPKETEQGKRSDLIDIRRKLDNRVSEAKIAEDHFSSWCRYNKSFRDYKRLKGLEEKRRWKMSLEIYIGDTGMGKSTVVDNKYPDAYWKDNTKWWDGYTGQEVVIWDEFYGHSCAFTYLLRLVDSKPMQVEVKNGYIQFTSKIICFTSNEEPEKWYSGEKTHQMSWEKNPLNRRIREFGIVYDCPSLGVCVARDPSVVRLSEESLLDVWAKNAEPDFGGQDPTVPLGGDLGFVPAKDKEEMEMPEWVSNPSVLEDLSIVLSDPQKKIVDFLK